MKPSTKKTMIIVAAVLAVAAIVYFAFFRKAKAGTAEGYIDRLDITAEQKKTIKALIPGTASAQDINSYASTLGISYEKALALAAAYNLVANGTIDEATWQGWVAQVTAM